MQAQKQYAINNSLNSPFSNEILADVMEYDVEMFINEMEGYPCLWNTSARSNHDQNVRKTAWNELSGKFGTPGMKVNNSYP